MSKEMMIAWLKHVLLGLYLITRDLTEEEKTVMQEMESLLKQLQGQ